MTKAIYFDMDGTIADLYGVNGWLDSLIAEQTKPYREAKPLVDMRQLGKLLNKLQAQEQRCLGRRSLRCPQHLAGADGNRRLKPQDVVVGPGPQQIAQKKLLCHL